MAVIRLWIVTPCSLVGWYRHLGVTCCFQTHLSSEDGGNLFFRDAGTRLHDYTVSQPGRPEWNCNGTSIERLCYCLTRSRKFVQVFEVALQPNGYIQSQRS
jgi:hypothetical protein